MTEGCTADMGMMMLRKPLEESSYMVHRGQISMASPHCLVSSVAVCEDSDALQYMKSISSRSDGISNGGNHEGSSTRLGKESVDADDTGDEEKGGWPSMKPGESSARTSSMHSLPPYPSGSDAHS